MTEELVLWHDFNVALVTASAGLLGLLFVALSLHVRALTARRNAELRSVARTIFLGYVVSLGIGFLALLPQTLTALGADFTRSHYPPSERLLEAFDRLGIVFWEQIPVWRLKGKDLARRQLRRTILDRLRQTILRDRNHASVMTWGAANEIVRGGYAETSYLAQAKALIRRLDPTRFFAVDQTLSPHVRLPAAFKTLDALGISEYVGWYGNDPLSRVRPLLDSVHRQLPGVALFAIRFNAVLTGFFLALELLVVLALAISGLVHLQQPLSIATSPVMADGKGGLMATPLNFVIAAIAVAMFSVNGYDSAINFSEETAGEARQVGRAVVLAASIGIALQLGTFLLVVFGVPDIKAFVNSTTPLLDAAKSSFGDTFYKIVAIGAIIAILNACLAITLLVTGFNLVGDGLRDAVDPRLRDVLDSRTAIR